MARDSEVPASTEEIIEDWLLDYAFTHALDEFGKTGQVLHTFNRDFLQGLMHMVSERTGSEVYHPQVLKLLTLCNISDGEHQAIPEDNEKTRLEMLLEEKSELLAIFGDTQAYRSWIVNIKRQAVFVCCRAGDFKSARRIYRNIWRKCDPSNMTAHVREVLEAADPDHQNLKDATYMQLLKQTFHLMEDQNTGHVPHLVLAARQHQLHQSGSTKHAACQTEPEPVPSCVTHLPDIEGSGTRELLESTTLQNLDSKTLQLPTEHLGKFMNKVKKISNNKEAYLKRIPFHDKADVDRAVTEEEQAADCEPPPQTLAAKLSKFILRSKAGKHRHKNHTHEHRRAKHAKNIRTPSSNDRSHSSARSNLSASNSSDDDRERLSKRDRKRHAECEKGSPQRNKILAKSRVTASSPDISSSLSPAKVIESRLDGYRRIKRHRRRVAMDTNNNNDSASDSEAKSLDELNAATRRHTPLILEERIGRPVEKVTKRQELAPQRILHGQAVDMPYMRIAWTLEEEETLYKAVQDCGVGNWAYIKDNYEFNQRSNVNLKDKWRNMLKCGTTQDLRSKYGPVLP